MSCGARLDELLAQGVAALLNSYTSGSVYIDYYEAAYIPRLGHSVLSTSIGMRIDLASFSASSSEGSCVHSTKQL